VFHWCFQSFPYVFADNDDLAATVDDARDCNHVIQSNLNHPEVAVLVWPKNVRGACPLRKWQHDGRFGLCLCWQSW